MQQHTIDSVCLRADPAHFLRRNVSAGLMDTYITRLSALGGRRVYPCLAPLSGSGISVRRLHVLGSTRTEIVYGPDTFTHVRAEYHRLIVLMLLSTGNKCARFRHDISGVRLRLGKRCQALGSESLAQKSYHSSLGWKSGAESDTARQTLQIIRFAPLRVTAATMPTEVPPTPFDPRSFSVFILVLKVFC